MVPLVIRETRKKQRCREPYEMKVSRTVLTGGMVETYRKTTRPVPTHYRRWPGQAGLSAGQDQAERGHRSPERPR